MGFSRNAILAMGAVLLAAACTASTARLDNAKMSGFLESYEALEPVERGYLYTNPNADWSSYGKVLLPPVTIWRSGENSLDEVQEEELAKVATLLDRAVRDRLSKDFQIVDEAGPGVLRLSLAITEALAADDQISIITAEVAGQPMPADDEISDELKAYADVAMIEIEARDAANRQLLAAAVDTYIAPPGKEKGSADDWEGVAEAFTAWADRLAGWFVQARRK
ncbi:MAG: DUF3313 domain-containing protein [Candidatus Binatia bacterium]|nr:DUF3313 domain-containing protein [Candidatus Binatia bacterium]